MTPNALHNSLLRPPVLHILRAAGFHATRPAALDTLVDLASRYLLLLTTQVASHAALSHNDLTPTAFDVRMALEDVGALRPQIRAMEEQVRGEEDDRGMQNFLAWIGGEQNHEIRRIAGLVASAGEIDVAADIEREDFLTALKKKHSKTGEESRYQGTMLGKEADEKPVRIEGGQLESIGSWEAHLRRHGRMIKNRSIGNLSSDPMSVVSSPLSEI